LLDQFKRYLLEQGYQPGDKISTEEELAAHFGVGRHKIREAAGTLCQMGVLDKKARRGTVVRSLDPESAGRDLQFRFALAAFDPADYQEARVVLERAILPLAIRRMTPAILHELETTVETMEANLTVPEVADAADREFHLLLLKACGNRTLQAFGQVIQALFRREYRQRYWTEEAQRSSAADHRHLVEAIDASDIEQALTIMAGHFK
jgi:DNA-binding FadR family transcriptional regulator